MIRIRCGSYCNGEFSGRGNYNTNTGQLLCTECTRYVDECTSNFTEWSDTSSNQGCGVESRTSYAPPASWGEATGWTTSGAYTQTTSRKPVTRTMIHFAG